MEPVCYLCGGEKVIQNYTGELYPCPECDERITQLEAENAALKALIQKAMVGLEAKADSPDNGATIGSDWMRFYYMLEDGLKKEGAE